jgi:tryptophan synthase alpha chain
MPPEEAGDLTGFLQANGVDAIFLLAPTSTGERMQKVAAQASGFIYYVSFKGVTGANRLDTDAVATRINEVRQYTDLPLGVGSWSLAASLSVKWPNWQIARNQFLPHWHQPLLN